MAETHETIADIIAEMRRGTRLPGYWRSCDVNEILQYHADQLEAALKRELSKNTSKNGADFGQLGDAAKLREALIEARRFVFAAMRGQHYILVNDGTNEPYVIRPKVTLTKIDAALAAPPRNCDVYNNESCRMAYHLYGDGLMTMQAFADWLFALATDKEGGAK